MLLLFLQRGARSRDTCQAQASDAEPGRNSRGLSQQPANTAASPHAPAQNNVFVPAYDVASLLSPCFVFRCVAQLQTCADQTRPRCTPRPRPRPAALDARRSVLAAPWLSARLLRSWSLVPTRQAALDGASRRPVVAADIWQG